MFTPEQYELLDFGDGRRLERFGDVRLDRPCPAVEDVRRVDPGVWGEVDARFERDAGDEGRWISGENPPEPWTIAHGPMQLELKCTPAGQLGVFPEQAQSWDWIDEQLRRADEPTSVLNLFAYTGGSTLTAAAAGAQVVHVDAARNVVAWARRNAELSGMGALPIRWIAEDAVKFVKRELHRGNRYDAVILDPPSYGHGPRGEVWRLSKHLPRLLQLCSELTAGRRRFMLLTCHTPGFDAAELETMLLDSLDDAPGTVVAGPLSIRAVDGRSLPSGVVARWTNDGRRAGDR